MATIMVKSAFENVFLMELVLTPWFLAKRKVDFQHFSK